MDEKEQKLKAAVEDLFKVLPREKVLDLIQQLIEMPDEDIKELIEYGRLLDERETTNQ
ncbi:hypothetical protein ACFVR1_03455 [Psychrobacillus sp. NPDC058041]|uniref:hypothetical protein n=1 Tax=Psychrobacillus sp. NPDC058041 TaxID=3346310 RepID=UPI0036D8F659